MTALTPLTLAKYLVGSRGAIERIAADRWALPVGFLLVLSGGLARNYDGAYLPAEWRVLLHGPVVSTANACLLYSLVYVPVYLKEGAPRPRFIPGLLSFVGLFWLTSPMAWLYAIPYERFLTPLEAINANLWTLAFVAAWRVLLMIRVLSVLYRAQVWAVAMIVILFSDAVLFAAARLAPSPIVDLMGGLQHTPEDSAIASANFLVTIYSFYTGWIWIIAGLVAMSKIRPRSAWPAVMRAPLPRALFALAAAALLAWAPILAVTQREQRLRYRAETMLRSGEVAAAFAEMSAHRRDQYPPIWDPPPRLGYGEASPSMDSVRATLAEGVSAPWVRDLYLDKSWTQFRRGVWVFQWDVPPTDREIGVAAAERTIDRADSFPRLIAAFHVQHDPRLAPEQRERLKALLDRAPAREPPAKWLERGDESPD